MAGGIHVNSAQIVGLFMESIFYGLYLVTCFTCLKCLLFAPTTRIGSKSRWLTSRLQTLSEINWIILVVALLLFSIATLDLALGLYRNIIAFVYYRGEGGPADHFGDISNWVNVTKTITVTAQTLLGDAILIHRCYIVYYKSFIPIIAPVILWCGLLATAIKQGLIESQLRSHAFISEGSLIKWIIAFWVITIVQNILTTGLIVYKIRSVNRASSAYSPSGSTILHRAMIIIVESGLLLTVVAVLTFITVLCNNSGLYPTSDMHVITVGIAFNLMVSRSLGARSKDAGTNSTRSNIASERCTCPVHSSIPLQSLNVNVQRSVQVSVGYGRDREDDYEGKKDMNVV